MAQPRQMKPDAMVFVAADRDLDELSQRQRELLQLCGSASTVSEVVSRSKLPWQVALNELRSLLDGGFLSEERPSDVRARAANPAPAETTRPSGVFAGFRVPRPEPPAGRRTEGPATPRVFPSPPREDTTPVPLVRRSSADLGALLAEEARAPKPLAPVASPLQNQVPTAKASRPPSRLPSPMLALSEFNVVERLAQGGTGTVYLARRGDGERFAIKVLRTGSLSNPDAKESLQREAEVLGRIQHPNIVRLCDIGFDGGEPFLVLEHIEGFSLSELLSFPLPMPLSVGVTIVRDALRGLQCLHEAVGDAHPLGVVHGDVSPQNLLVGAEGRTRLIDFGVAREPGQPCRDSVVRCKPRYASPELLAGDPLGAESDLFAVGVVLFQVLTGRKLFDASEPQHLLAQVTHALVPPPSTVARTCPPAFDAVCQRALERDRSRRIQTARDMLRELEQAAETAGLPLSEDVVSAWVRRVQSSFTGDVELQAEEVVVLGSLLEGAKARDAEPEEDEPKGHARLRFAAIAVACLLAIALVAFALLAPERFVQTLSPAVR